MRACILLEQGPEDHPHIVVLWTENVPAKPLQHSISIRYPASYGISHTIQITPPPRGLRISPAHAIAWTFGRGRVIILDGLCYPTAEDHMDCTYHHEALGGSDPAWQCALLSALVYYCRITEQPLVIDARLRLTARFENP